MIHGDYCNHYEKILPFTVVKPMFFTMFIVLLLLL